MIDTGQKFSTLARAGFFSRAVLYAVLGVIALTNMAPFAEGTNGIFMAIESFPLGELVLWAMVVGLVGYALFRFASAFFDIEHQGSDTKGWATRAGHAGSAIGHLALAWSATKFASDISDGGNGAQDAASGLLSLPLGGVILGLLGLAFLAAAAFQVKKGLTGEFMCRIDVNAPSITRTLGAIGYVARAVVFVVIGWSLVRAGFLDGSTSEINTLGEAVAALAGQGVWFTLVAGGMLVFGVFSLILARYRIIPEFTLNGRVPMFRA